MCPKPDWFNLVGKNILRTLDEWMLQGARGEGQKKWVWVIYWSFHRLGAKALIRVTLTCRAGMKLKHSCPTGPLVFQWAYSPGGGNVLTTWLSQFRQILVLDLLLGPFIESLFLQLCLQGWVEIFNNRVYQAPGDKLHSGANILFVCSKFEMTCEDSYILKLSQKCHTSA